MQKWAFLPILILVSYGALAQQKAGNKLSPLLNGKTIHQDSINVSVSLQSLRLPVARYRLLNWNKENGIALLRLKGSDLLLLAAQESVRFINEQSEAVEELATGASDLSLNRIRFLQQQRPTLRGDSIKAMIKERSFDPSDIDLAERSFATNLESNLITTHASVMATIAAGGGNTAPFTKGAAPAASVGGVSFSNLLPESDSTLRHHRIAVVNHSYGTVIENFYGNEAAAYDRQAFAIPEVLHVFSAGNSGASAATSGRYAGITGFANFTGNFKAAKNALVVGATDSAGAVVSISSRGPVNDGRIKPELVAYGEDGSSGAAATVSGTALLLQQAYSRKYNGLRARSATLRAILLNSAEDIYTIGPDHISGFGSLDASAAVGIIENGWLVEDSVAAGGVKTFTLPVPPNSAHLKLTLTWTDPPALAGAAKTLVNDLNLELTDAGGTLWQPWILSTSPDAASLNAPAQRGIDTLNNVEQISIEQPASGIYTIRVSAGSLSGAGQAFSLAWSTRANDEFQWTYPGILPLESGNRHWLRWQTNVQGPAVLHYRAGGGQWVEIDGAVDLGRQYYRWQPPDGPSLCQLRMTLPNGSVVLSDAFPVAAKLRMEVGFNCGDSVLLKWNVIPGVNYLVSRLDGAYLQPFRQTSDTTILLAANGFPSSYYAVAPLVNGVAGSASYTINYASQAGLCYVQSFVVQNLAGTTVQLRLQLGTLYNVGGVVLEKMANGNGYALLQQVLQPAATTIDFTDPSLPKGRSLYRVRIQLMNGSVVYSDPIELYGDAGGEEPMYFPNPVPKGERLRVFTAEAGRFVLEVFDAGGRRIHTEPLNQSLTILPGGWPSGLYLLRLRESNGKAISRKFIIQ